MPSATAKTEATPPTQNLPQLSYHVALPVCPGKVAAIPMKIVLRIALAATALWIVAGCGQKGPLFLPGDPSQVRTGIPELPERPDDAGAGTAEGDGEGQEEEEEEDSAGDVPE